MRRRDFIALLGGVTIYPVTIRAQQAANGDDGSSGAPFGTIQYPNLLKAYPVRPRWNVAGVDYPVGCPTNISLKVPSPTWSGPGDGVSFPLHFTNETGYGYQSMVSTYAGAVVLDGWDLTGWRVECADNGNPTTVLVQNCRIAVSGMGSLFSTYSSGNGSIQYCTFDGNNGAIYSDSNMAGGLLNLRNAPNAKSEWTVRYCLFKDAYSDHVDYGGIGTGPQSFVFQYNMFWNSGMGADMNGHPDVLQGGWRHLVDFKFDFNTVVQDHYPRQGATQGVACGTDANGGGVITGYCSNSYNTYVATGAALWSGGGVNWGMDFALDQMAPGAKVTITNNYFDATGMRGIKHPPPKFIYLVDPQRLYKRKIPSFVTITGNVNLLDGSAPTLSNHLISW